MSYARGIVFGFATIALFYLVILLGETLRDVRDKPAAGRAIHWSVLFRPQFYIPAVLLFSIVLYATVRN